MDEEDLERIQKDYYTTQEGLISDLVHVCNNNIYRKHEMKNTNNTPPPDEMTIEQRLELCPDSFTDADLKQLMSYPRSRGRSAKIAPRAFLELDRRHSPTEAK